MLGISFAWNIDYDVAALAMFLIMLFMVLATQNVSSWQFRTFRQTLIVCIITTVIELILANAFAGWGLQHTVLLTILVITSELFVTAISLMFCLNFITMTMTYHEFRRKWFWLTATPFTAAVIAAVAFSLNQFHILEGGQQVMSRGTGSAILTAIRFLYIIVGLAFAIRYFRRLTFLQKTAMIFFTAAMMVSILYSALTDYRVLTLFEIAASAMLMFVTLQNPMAYRDSVTNTSNEKAFYDTAHSMIGDAHPFTVISIHPEVFTSISSTIGRANGDKVLQAFASYLTSLDKDAFIFHLAGTKFAMIMKGGEDPSNMIREIRTRFESPFRIGALEVPLSAVIICLRYPEDFTSEDELASCMEYSLQIEVKSHDTQVFYGNEFSEGMRKRDQVIGAMEAALDGHLIEVFYQPIYSTEEKGFTSAEALARLPDGRGGYIPPGEFIPLAEQRGDIIRLGEMVLQSVCSFISTSRPQDYGIRTINVNLSAIQCMQEKMAEHLISIIDANQVPHGMITFEITESSAAVSSEKTGELVRKLRSQNIRFTLDDYGTGYSNVGNLIAYDYSIVKIDKSIVWASQKDRKSMLALKHILAMINDFSMIPLAEGIETPEMAESMDSIGCHVFQGFLYSMPVPGGKFMQIIRDRKSVPEGGYNERR